MTDTQTPDPLDGPDARRRELGAFLRSRRERITPEDVGFAPRLRRRTPGLRREEVAELAGIGVSWYTWLEQGRAIQASGDVVDAIGRALRLDRDEHEHLRALAGLGPNHHDDGFVLPRQVQTILDQLEPCPAYVVNACYELLAWNRTEAELVGGLDHLPPGDRNFLWLAFTDPAWRELLVDWEDDVGRMVARYRAAMGHHIGEPAWSQFVRRLSAASPEFTRMWERHEVHGPSLRPKRFRHPRVGPLTLDHMTLQLAEVPGCELRIYTATDAVSQDALRRLALLAEARASGSRTGLAPAPDARPSRDVPLVHAGART